MTVAELVLPVRHASQERVVAEAARFNVLACGRRWGKTTLFLDLLLDDPGFGALHGHPVAWFAGSSKIFDEVWRLMLETLPREIIKRTDTQKHRIELRTGGIIDFWSLDGGDSGGAGRGRKYRRAAVDEAALVPGMMQIWSKAIRPTLIDLKGDAWFASTPRGLQNDFHELFLRGQQRHAKALRNWRSWQVPTGSNPCLPAEELKELKGEYAGRPLDYRQEILAEFVADAGAVFKLEWLREESLPKNWKPHVYQAWDLAGTKKDLESEDGCYSVGVALAKDWLHRWWLVDVVRGKWDSGELVEQILRFARKHRAVNVWGEDPVALYLEPFIRERCQQSGKHSPFTRVSVQGRGDKVARAQAAVVPVMANGSFYVDPAAPWLADLKDELASFPSGHYLDQVDALSLGLAESMQVALTSPPPPAAETRDPGKITWDDLTTTTIAERPRRSPWKR